jgi:membrane-bound lytic murein transglycosylase B
MHAFPARPSRRRRHATTLLSLALSGCASVSSTTPPPSVPVSMPAPAAPAAAAASASASAPTAGDEDAAVQQRFAAWIANFRESARAAGIADETLRDALGSVHYRPRLVDLDRTQPEFTRAVWDYVDGIVSPQRVAKGLEQLAQVRPEAETAAARHGVPPAMLVAIWGMESDYGANYGDVPTIDALATLGFEGRREAWARAELLAALRILQAGDIDRAHMVGSWAGAMGQTQFLPSTYLAHAVDADGDGRRDIWNSMADVLASTANFLARSGWKPAEPWGAEVQLPPGFDAGRADASVRQPAAQWSAEGVRAMDGAPLPAIADGAILLPAGVHGPAFLVGANFRAILRYNNSTSYALAVGLLAQRLAGGPGVRAPWPRELGVLGRTELQALQSALGEHGFDSGKADGTLGPATRDALRRYQRSIGLPADGYPTPELLRRLQEK